jgi:uncharacterized protein YbjT (DUF2867 family)
VAGSKEKQWQIDYEIPARFAEIARKNGVSKVVVLSAYGASPTSKVYYSMMKGKLDEHITQLGFQQCIIFQPGMLLRAGTDRSGERIAAPLLRFLNTLGIARKFRPLPTSILAEKLAKAPKVPASGKQVVKLEDVFTF